MCYQVRSASTEVEMFHGSAEFRGRGSGESEVRGDRAAGRSGRGTAETLDRVFVCAAARREHSSCSSHSLGDASSCRAVPFPDSCSTRRISCAAEVVESTPPTPMASSTPSRFSHGTNRALGRFSEYMVIILSFELSSVYIVWDLLSSVTGLAPSGNTSWHQSSVDTSVPEQLKAEKSRRVFTQRRGSMHRWPFAQRLASKLVEAAPPVHHSGRWARRLRASW